MTSIFWEARGIVYINYLENEKTTNSDYYTELLMRLKDKIARKQPHMKKKKNHISSGQCIVPQINENNGQIERVGLQSASTPIILSRANPQQLLILYWSQNKKMLQKKRFGSNEEVIATTEAYFEAKDKLFYKRGIEKL